MRSLKTLLKSFIACCLIASFLPLVSSAQIVYPDPKTYLPKNWAGVEKHKKFFDDPRPWLTSFGPKQVLPKELYAELTYNEEKMKSLWAELVGFRAPDVVGKIAPEIRPGKYTYKDLEKYPGLKELMHPDLYNRIKPGGPPHSGNIPEFEIIPTRQYYWALPVAENTKKNMEKTKLDAKGFLKEETWEGGYPFPRPSGEFKAQQIMYNVERRALSWEFCMTIIGHINSFNKNLKLDFDAEILVHAARLAKRSLMSPYGWFDERAKKRGEFKQDLFAFTAPRDYAGMTQESIYFLDPNKTDQYMMYIPSLRRVRKWTATDSQDPIAGQDLIYDDKEGFLQRLSPTHYPYKCEILEEREYLVWAPTVDGAEYVSSNGMELRNVRMERRPIYVVKLTQLDPNYVYRQRIFYVDKETFLYYHIANYDQKGRLYRTWEQNYGWFPEMGMFSWHGSWILMRDHIDSHSCLGLYFQVPSFWNRENLSLEGFIKQK